jgi:hypothetical protein
MLKDLPVFFIAFLGLLSVKRAVVHNEIETALEVLCSSELNFQILEMNFQNERTVRNWGNDRLLVAPFPSGRVVWGASDQVILAIQAILPEAWLSR